MNKFWKSLWVLLISPSFSHFVWFKILPSQILLTKLGCASCHERRNNIPLGTLRRDYVGNICYPSIKEKWLRSQYSQRYPRISNEYRMSLQKDYRDRISSNSMSENFWGNWCYPLYRKWIEVWRKLLYHRWPNCLNDKLSPCWFLG